MKEIIKKYLRKWMILAVLGLIAYLLGFLMAQGNFPLFKPKQNASQAYQPSRF